MKRVLLAAVAALLVVQPGTVGIHAQSGNTFQFFKNYFVTGDYAVGGVGLRGSGGAERTIAISGVPNNADVLGAFLYWQSVVTAADIPTASTGVTFEGSDLGPVTTGEVANLVNTGSATPCWSAGGATGGSNGSKALAGYRADVMRFMTDVVTEAEALADPTKIAGKLDVNRTYRLTVPDAGSGSGLPLALGASLVIIFRDPSKPLKSIVMYDGTHTLNQGSETFLLDMLGFYQASGTNTHRLTAIVGDGQTNFSERVQFDGGDVLGYPLQDGPFRGTSGTDWDNVTFTSANFPLNANASTLQFGINRQGLSSYDCLSIGAVVMSTEVKDTDNDGLLDVWEMPGASSLPTPNVPAQPLPELAAMGANPNQKDVFFEVGYLQSAAYSNPEGPVAAHNHLPSRLAVNMVGNALRDAGITAHIDVGNNYQGDAYVITTAQGAIGGDAFTEAECLGTCTTPLAFPGYRGTVGWKSGYRFLRDQVFDANRLHSFRYVLFAHALGIERRDAEGEPIANVPSKTSGVADPPGGDILITLGFWDDHKGTDFMQASTWLHEFGHNGNLRHGGAVNEPNCKPNYLSVMSYLFQTRGLVCDATSTAPACLNAPGGSAVAGRPVIGFSSQVLPGVGLTVDELNLNETVGLGSTRLAYRTRWYSPTSAIDQSPLVLTTPSSKHCDGSPLYPDETGLYRIDGTNAGVSSTGVVLGLDWNGNGTINTGTLFQDITFSGDMFRPDIPEAERRLQILNASTNDWATLDLRHVASRRNVGGLSIGVTPTDLNDLDPFFDPSTGDFGKGDFGKGDFGKGDFGKGDFGKGDFGKGDFGAPPGDLDLDTARHVGNAPNQLIPQVFSKFIRVSWTPPHVDKNAILRYDVFRSIGATVTGTNFVQVSPLAGVTGVSFDDFAVKNNTTYTYFVRAVFDGDKVGADDNVNSGISNFQTILKK